jgi:hypothetical protein
MTRDSPADSAERGLTLDIHGRVALYVEPDVPSLDILATMFAPFVTDTEALEPDIVVRRAHEPINDPSHNEHDYRYDDRSVWLSDMDVQISRDAAVYTVSGSRELLTAVLPLIDELTTMSGAAMIHATTVEIGGQGILMPAWGGVGKTSTMAKVLKHSDCRFMGDDWGFLTSDGELLGYAKPMFIKPHHRPIYPHLFTGRRKPLIPSRLSRPIGRLTTLVHPVVTKAPAIAAVIRRWSPEHKMVTPAQAFPDIDVSTKAPLRAAIFVERYDGDVVELEPRNSDWMLNRLVGNFYCELPQQSRDVITALSATGMAPMHTTFSAKAEVVRKGIDGIACHLLRVPAEWTADRASDVICDHLLSVAGRSDVVATVP